MRCLGRLVRFLRQFAVNWTSNRLEQMFTFFKTALDLERQAIALLVKILKNKTLLGRDYPKTGRAGREFAKLVGKKLFILRKKFEFNCTFAANN